MTNEEVQWAVQRPDGLVFVQASEADARGWVEQGNADGKGRYRLLRRPVPSWTDVTDPATCPGDHAPLLCWAAHPIRTSGGAA